MQPFNENLGGGGGGVYPERGLRLEQNFKEVQMPQVGKQLLNMKIEG